MKVAILVPRFVKFSGDAKVAAQQARDFAARGDQVDVFAFDADMAIPGVKVFLLGLPRNLFIQSAYRLLFPLDLVKTITWLRVLKSYDLAIAHLYPMTGLACLARRRYGVKYTFWNHGTGVPALFATFFERTYTRLYQRLTWITTANADRTVSVSQYLREEFRCQTGRDSEVVRNTVDLHRFHPGLDRRVMRGKYNLGSAPVILSVGRISPPKGFHLLVQAFALIKAKVPQVKLVIVGNLSQDRYGGKLLASSGDSIIVTGSVSDEDLPYYYAMCDVYATCTLWEGFDLPIAEAQACGKAVVAFRLGPHPEVVDERGTLVETGNVESFAQACLDQIQRVRTG